MTLDLPFNIGDSLYWVDVRTSRYGPTFAAIQEETNGIHGVVVTLRESGEPHIKLISEDGTADEIATKYACLSRDQAVTWIKTNLPGSVILTGEQYVWAQLTEPGKKPKRISVIDSIQALDEYVCWFSASKLSETGHMVIYNANAETSGDPLNAIITNPHKKPSIAYGQYLTVRALPDRDEMFRLTDIDENALKSEENRITRM